MKKKELKSLVEEWQSLKEIKSDIAKKEKEVKEKLSKYLEDEDVLSVAVGDNKVSLEVSGYSIETDIIGVKASEATNQLTQKLLEKGATNLLSITPKKALLFQLQEKGDKEFSPLLAELGIQVTTNETVKLK